MESSEYSLETSNQGSFPFLKSRGEHWIAEASGECISVPAAIYERIMQERIGELTTLWFEQVALAEQAYQRKCAAELKIQSDLAFWKSLEGVTVEPVTPEQ